MNLLYCVFLALWRRCFGSDGWNIPIIKNRAIQHIIGFIACLGILWYNGVSWWQGVLAGLVLQGLYWAKGHGEFFDFGHSNPPDVKRYEKEWWWKYVKKIMPESVYYTFTCDFICMSIRYGLPSLLLGIVLLNPVICFAGLVLSCAYAIMWVLYDWLYTSKPTETAEFIAGFTTGMFISFFS